MHQLSRQELYVEVWSTTLSALSKKYDITDRGLAKLCDRYKIPRPRNGYWTKLKHGKRIPIPPLPEVPEGKSEIIRLNEYCSEKRVEQNKLESSIEYDPRILKLTKIQLPESTSRYHELIGHYKRAHSAKHTNRYGFLTPSYLDKDQPLDITVTKGSLVRALRLLQHLITIFKKIGWELTTYTTKYSMSKVACFNVDDEYLRFKIKERVKQVTHVLTDKERKDKERYKYSYAPKHDYLVTGELSFTIEGYWPNCRFKRKWSDKPNSSLESQYVDIAKGLISAAHYTKVKRIEDERIEAEYRAQRAAQEERRRKLEIESAKIKLLMDEAERYERQKKVLSLIKHLEGAENISDELSSWLSWVKDVTSDINPTIKSDRILQEFHKLDKGLVNEK